MSQQCHSQSQGADKSDALALYARLNDVRAKLSVARTRDSVITEKVEKLKNDLQSARDEFLQLRSLNDKSLQVLFLKRIEASSIREATKRKYEVIDKLAHLSQDVHFLSRYKKAHREMQAIAKQFRSDCKTSPWVPEKQELINALESDSSELASVKREMEYMDSKIKEREEMLELHALHPFKDFCTELAMYNRKCMAIKKLLFREMQVNTEMKAKLAENGMDESLSQNLSQSQMTNMMQTMSQRSSTAGGYGISQTQTVSGSQDKSSQRYGAGTGASFFFGNLDTSEVASPTHPPALRVASLDTSDLDTSIGKKKASQSNNSNNPSSSPLRPITPDAPSMDASDLDTTIAAGIENDDSAGASPARSGSPTEIAEINAADLDTTAINENEDEQDDEPPLEEQETVVFQEPLKKVEKAGSDVKEKPNVAMEKTKSPAEKKQKQNGNESDVEHMFFQSGPEISQNNFLNFSLHSANTSQVAAGDILSLLNAVDESMGGGGGFFDLFGGDAAGGVDAAGDGDKETQESAGGMFNFDFGGGTSMDTDGDQTGGGGGAKSFFNF